MDDETFDLSVREYQDIISAVRDGFDAEAMCDWLLKEAPRQFLKVYRESCGLHISDAFREVHAQMCAEKKVGAIKALREITGLGLKEAKDFVELDYSAACVGALTYKSFRERVVEHRLHWKAAEKAAEGATSYSGEIETLKVHRPVEGGGDW